MVVQKERLSGSCILLRNAATLDVPASGTAVTVGSFDGVHLGHRHLISSALSSGLPTAVVSFYPHPGVSLGRFEGRRLALSTFRQKHKTLEALGVRYFVPVLFSSQFREFSAREFVEKYLVERLQARVVVLGEDACFGRGKELRAPGIERLLAGLGVECRVVPFLEIDGERVSSRRVRAAISIGNLEEAKSLLGRPYAIEGRVVPGDQRGASIGAPTANLHTPSQLLPPHGVYATRSRIEDREWLSVTNIGVRPTFRGSGLRVETHLLDYSGEPLYRHHLEVSFLAAVRSEKAFKGIAELKTQIAKDIEWVRNRFG